MSASTVDWQQLAACCLVLTDEQGRFIQANEHFLHALGLSSNDILERRLSDLLTVGGRIFHQTHWLPLMQMQGGVSEIKLDFVRHDGQRVPMVVNARAVTLPDGRVGHSIAAFLATDRSRFEQALVAARREAQELLRERTALQEEASERSLFAEQLIGIVSHDMRNPLSAIRMGVDMLAMGSHDAAQNRIAERINKSVDRALLLVEDLLDFTLTKTGRSLEVVLADIDLHQVAATGLEELQLAFPKLQLRHESSGDGRVKGSSERLVRVVGNLVANAARYGDNQKPVTVRTLVSDTEAYLDVHNFGPPIDPLLLPIMFQAMTRGVSANAGGVGLGLYIVSQIAIAHGGHASVSSSEANGTRIGIQFPICPGSAVD